MSLLEYIKEIFRTETEAERLEKFIVNNNPQTVGDIEALTRKYDRRQTMQRFTAY